MTRIIFAFTQQSCFSRNNVIEHILFFFPGSEEGESRFCDKIFGPALLKRLMKRQDALCSKRVMFLANALLMSDFSSTHRVNSILSGIVPDIFSYLNSPDIDVRETYLRLLSTATSTAAGLDILLPELAGLQDALTAKLLSLAEEDYETSQIEDILMKISGKDKVASTTTVAGSDIDTSSADSSTVLTVSPPEDVIS